MLAAVVRTLAMVVRMSVFAEFSLESEEFHLGRLLSSSTDVTFDMDRIVPSDGTVVPFLWATGTEFDEFERSVWASDEVTELAALDQVRDEVLYRITYAEPPDSIVGAITTANATVLEANGNDRWTFRLRFPDHARLTDFYNYCTAESLPVQFDRIYTLTEDTPSGHRLGLSEAQREALVLAVRRGYFATPSETSLRELADELDITQQALSNRIRRGNEQVLHNVLVSSAADSE